MVQLYHNRNVNKNSLLFKVDYTSVYDFTFHLHFYHSMNEKHSQGLLPDNFRNLSART